MNHYEVLQVNRLADAEAIRDAYRLQMQVWHPDKHTGTKLADRADSQSKRIAEAWSVLKDPTRRASYDATTFPVRETPKAEPVSVPRPAPKPASAPRPARPAPAPRPAPMAPQVRKKRNWVRDSIFIVAGLICGTVSVLAVDGDKVTGNTVFFGLASVLLVLLGLFDTNTPPKSF